MLFSVETKQKLVGIARLASQSEALATKKSVAYRELASRSILNRCASKRVPFAWTINPYRGCEIGCHYCYARYTHEFMGMEDPRLFERRIFSKANAAALLTRELRHHKKGDIAIGTSTDPYQPAEKRFRVTRSLLEVFAKEKGRTLSITTKSGLITRDIDLLSRIRRANVLHVNITITTVDAALAQKLEPKAPRPQLRLKTVKQLAAAGISVGVFANPVMPLLTDSIGNLENLARAAADAGAKYLGGGVLFLMPSAQAQFFPFLDREFPALSRRYRKRYLASPYLRGEYERLIRRRLTQARHKFGLAAAPLPYRPEDWDPDAPAERQLNLFGDGSQAGYPAKIGSQGGGSPKIDQGRSV